MNASTETSRMQIKVEPESDDEEEGYTRTRLDKFSNEADNFENFFEENDFFEENLPRKESRFKNIIIVTDELHKEYVSQLKSENINVNLVMCKNLWFNELDLSDQACENSLLLVVPGLHSIATVNNLPDLISPYIPTIKKLSWNMKKLPEYENEYRESLKVLNDMVPETCTVVLLPPLPAVIMVNCLKTTKSKKFSAFYYQFIEIISKLTIEILEEQNISCDSIRNYLNVEDPVYEIELSNSQNQFVLSVKEWNHLGKWYDIVENIAGLEMKLDCPFVGYRRLDSGKEDTSSNNVLSAASFIRQTNLVPSDNIPEIEKLELEECMGPTLTKWPAGKPLPPLPGKTEEYELMIFKDETYKQQAAKLKEDCNFSRQIVVIGEKLAVEKFSLSCAKDFIGVKIHRFHVEENDYEATMKNIPSNLLNSSNTIWILFCDIASSMMKKKQSFCERHFQDQSCTVELYMNSLNCSVEKDRCKKLNEFLQKLFPLLGANSIVIPSPIIPQNTLLPASDLFKMQDFHNLVHELEYLKHLWIFQPSMQKLQITNAVKTFEKEWWKNVEKIILMQNLNLEFLSDYKENTAPAVVVVENPRLVKETNEAYEDWDKFMKAIIIYYMHIIENTHRAPIKIETELVKETSNKTKSKAKKKQHGFVPQPHPVLPSNTQNALQQLSHEDLATYKRKIYINDIPKSLSNTALKNILNICGYVTGFHREVIAGHRAALCKVTFRDIESVYRAFYLLNEMRVLSSKLCVVIPDEKHFTDSEKIFDHKYEQEDVMQIKSIIADVSSWSSRTPEHQKTKINEPTRYVMNSQGIPTQVVDMNPLPSGRVPLFEEDLYKEQRQTRHSISPDERYYRSPKRKRSRSRDIKSEKRYKSRDERSRDRSRSRDRRRSQSSSRSRSRDRSISRSPSRSRGRRSSSRSRSRSRHRRRSPSRSRSRSRDKRRYRSRSRSRSHERISSQRNERLSSKQISSVEFNEGRECLALVTLSENLGVLGVSFKMLMESCLQTQSIETLQEEDNMTLMDTIYRKFSTLKNSTSDIIKAEKFKCGAKICKKLIDAVISKKLTKQIAVPPTIPLQLPKASEKSVSISHFPTTSKTAENKQLLHGVEVGTIAKCTMGKDAGHIKNFIKNSLEYVGVEPTIDTIYEIFSAVSMIHFKAAMSEQI